ncbi:MAG: restriction endonuclease, partial [Lentisphaerae bacterium]|nr:restriction endonuclease [Lentisphaerota bacterium]
YKGLETQIPDNQERLKHILENQIHGFAPTEIIYNIAKNYIFGNFANINHTNLKHHDLTPAAKQGDPLNMKFDVIVGNPPYQEDDRGAQASAKPIYQLFVEQAKKINPHFITMITPSRWFTGGKGLDDFRANMLKDERIRKLVDYPNPNECFPGVPIKGGVCYFIWDRENPGICEVTTIRGNAISKIVRPLAEKNASTFIRYNEAITILGKIAPEPGKTFDTLISSRKPFGLKSNFKDFKQNEEVKLYANKEVGYISKEQINHHVEWINKWKVFISYAYGAGEDFPHQIINKPFVGEPGSACTETYLLIGPFERKMIARNVMTYMATRFFRFLVLQLKNTQHATSKVYSFVPMQDFSKPWTDDELYKKYGLDDDEIAFIESMIRPMEID